MKITDILKNQEITVSFELFPPKPEATLGNMESVVKKLADLNPSFMSVTCGAGGKGVSNTLDVVKEVQHVNNIPALAHLIGISLSKEEIINMLNRFKANNITNIMALRGDYREGAAETAGAFKYASDLIKEIHKHGDFTIGGGCYPEGHQEAPTIEKDIEHLKIKIDAGCQFLTTQMFFDNNILYNFMNRLHKKAINVPVIAGIMPVTNAKQIDRIFKLSGTTLPPRFSAIVNRFENSPKAMRQAGIAFATEQIVDLIANGINNIHIYVMNKPLLAKNIMDNLSEIFR